MGRLDKRTEVWLKKLKRKDNPGATCMKWDKNVKSDLTELQLEDED